MLTIPSNTQKYIIQGHGLHLYVTQLTTNENI